MATNRNCAYFGLQEMRYGYHYRRLKPTYSLHVDLHWGKTSIYHFHAMPYVSVLYIVTHMSDDDRLLWPEI